MKNQHKVFDTVVLGTGLSGLIAANRLTKENQSVLLLQEERHRSSYTKDGYRFFPFTNFSEKRIQTGLLKKISHLVDRRENRKERDKADQKASFQVILPESRIDLYRDPSLMQGEWRREFPHELKQIESFYAELRRIKQVLKEIKSKADPESNFPICDKSFLKRWLSFDGLPRAGTGQSLSSFSPEFKKFIELQMISYGHLCSDSFPIPLVSHLLLHDDGDEWEERIELENIGRGMIEKFSQSGGTVKETEGVEKAEVKRRGGFSLSLKGEDMTVRSRNLLLNSPLDRLSSLFGKKGKALSEWGRKIRPRYILIPFFLGIDERVVPVGMGNLLVSMLNLQNPYEGGNLLFLRLSQQGDERHAPEGKRALTVQCLMPYEESREKPISDLQDGVMKHLKHLFPFLENHIEFIDWTWAEDQRDCWSYPHYIYEMDSGFKWREGIVPTRISNKLYFSGRENFPYLGLEGEILGGLLSGAQILK